MLDRLADAADGIGADAVARVTSRLAWTASLPGDVRIEPMDGGVVLTGRGLRRRRIDDPRLRSFGQ